MTLRTAIAALLLCASVASAGWIQWYQAAGAARRGGGTATPITDAANCIARWQFDPAVDTTALIADGSGNGNVLTAKVACTWATNAGKACGYFPDGKWYESLSTNILGPAASFTFSAWIWQYTNPNTAAGRGIVDNRPNDLQNGLLQTGWDDASKFSFVVNDGYLTAGSNSTTGQWIHVAGTYQSGAPGTTRLWRNGVLVASGGQWPPSRFGKVAVGREYYFGTTFLGYLRDVRIYKTANTNNIALLYAEG